MIYEMFYGIIVIISVNLYLTQSGKVHFTHVTDETKIGKIGGKAVTMEDGTSFIYFYGIPYAKKSTNDGRFEEPLLLNEPFDGIWDATYSVQCLQYRVDYRKIVGKEDCLSLNIFTTTLEKTANRDVLVYFHGGGFSSGAGELHSPDFLYTFTKSLVFVSINYRLGPFGFLSTEDSVVPGNNGLKDQVIALKWIQQNIQFFGGNPHKVTIAGMEAGAVSVHLHYFSPLSRDLFKRGMSMSGTAFSPMVKTTNIRKEAEHLASLMKCPTTSSLEMVECLKKVDGKELLQQLVNSHLPWEDYSSYYVRFGPVVEKKSNSPFLDTHPFFLLKKSEVKSAPWLVSTLPAEGYVSEYTFINDQKMLERLNNEWNDVAPSMLLYSDLGSNEQILKTSQMVRSEYLKDKSVTKADHTELAKLIGDRVFVSNIENAVRLHAAASKEPVYLYTFDYHGKYSFAKTSNPASIALRYFDDLMYIFSSDTFDYSSQDESDMVNKIAHILLSFMESGLPGEKIQVKWPTVSTNAIKAGDLNYVKVAGPHEITIVSSPGISKREFWDRLPLNELHIVGDQKIPAHIKALQQSGAGGFISNILYTILHILRVIFISPIEALVNLSSSK